MLWSMNIEVGTKYAYPLGNCLTLEGPQIYFGDRRSYILNALSDMLDVLGLCWEQLLCPWDLCVLMRILVLKDLCLPSPGLYGPSVGNSGLGGRENCVCLEVCFIEHGVVGNIGNIITFLLCPCLSLS